MDHFFNALDALVPLADGVGTGIFIENMPFAFLPGADELLDALACYGNGAIGVVYDVANGHFVGEDVGAALRACAPRLRAIHLSDTDRTTYRHAAIGEGTVSFHPLPALLAEIGFERRPILEIITADPDEAIEGSARRLLEMGF
jgi:sugar phosphate isomerase/epimerase